MAAIVGVVSSEVEALLYPVALTSVGGTLMMLTMVNTMLWVTVLHRIGQARSWRQVLPLLMAGLATALLELVVLNLIRAWLSVQLGMHKRYE